MSLNSLKLTALGLSAAAALVSLPAHAGKDLDAIKKRGELICGASTCWVAGLTTSRHSVVFDSTHWPSISSLTCSTLVLLGDCGAFICVLLGIIVGTRSPAPGKREVAS